MSNPIAPFYALCLTVFLCAGTGARASEDAGDPFRRLGQTALGLGQFRSANGTPAANYWQQRVDYELDVQLLPEESQLDASALVHYHNNSPDRLHNLYFALDQDALLHDSTASYQLLAGDPPARTVVKERAGATAGFNIESVQLASGQTLQWQQHGTLMQVRLPAPLESGDQVALSFRWRLGLLDKQAAAARSGYEALDDGSRIFLAAQWFPRAVAYTDYAGWQLKPFLQQGEFSPELGRYRVRITVPENYVVAASGELQNARDVLDREQLRHWDSETGDAQWIVDAGRAQQRRGRSTDRRKEWFFQGEQLRDFAFAASPVFQWLQKQDRSGRRLQLFFPAEAASLWETFGLAAMEHTLEIFDSATFPLPRQSISVVNVAGVGMEYPGLSAIGLRPQRNTAETNADDTSMKGGEEQPWDAQTKYDFIGSVIHEVGHNYLPMAINTDEREWAWLDEGLVSFLEYRAEHAWEASFQVIYGEPRSVAGYTLSANHQPIMTSADSLKEKVPNAYNKTASVLNMLRHLVMGPETFDRGLRRFARDWQGKRPVPGDFFRAMENAAGEDLSWFWRSWFYAAHHVDFAITGIAEQGTLLSTSPIAQPEPPALAYTAGEITSFAVDRDPELVDGYTKPLEQQPVAQAMTNAGSKLPAPGETTRWFQLTLANGGNGLLPMPLDIAMDDGRGFRWQIPAQTWMRADRGRLVLQVPLPDSSRPQRICIDPLWLTPDTDRSNNCIEIEAL
ncbi:M1 family metallopeptidase [Microbulbifer sp. YPW16]|uniref:M1 family metallopeptidase n=1 Tax=Microbulbifer sp. YPW16 TaxID=2904242 RepID=UPI001E40E5E8|nr:M1 family metallopeptidase [Microbulbifer sp. YPW16]UHQ55391.1 M1 family metallopeptidase [Microbulbifer sp. YPW16]